ncbi:hypothetical protein M433DRAFT_39807, partial [Acidomyces richmondensis BFW]
LPLGLRLAHALGLTGAAFLAGKTFAQSFSAVPAMLHAPAPLLARQWKTMFTSDKLLAPAIVLVSGSIFGYFAYRDSMALLPGRLYAASAALLVLNVPYSFFCLEPINRKLEVRAARLSRAGIAGDNAEVEAMEFPQQETVHQLVDRWATVNLGRSVLSILAAL